MAKLKIKTKLNYRRGYTHSSCNGCDFFRHDFRIMGIGNVFLKYDGRCTVMGLESSRKYHINPDNICDSFDQTEGLRRAQCGSGG